MNNNFLIGVNPYVQYDTKWTGIGGGLHLGNLVSIFEDKTTDGSGVAKTGISKSILYPQLSVRFGPVKYFFIDYKLADHFPSALPGFRNQLGVGTGFGANNGMYARFGTNFDGILISGYFPLNNGLILEPLVIWAESYDSGSNSVRLRKMQFSLGISYRFGEQNAINKLR